MVFLYNPNLFSSAAILSDMIMKFDKLIISCKSLLKRAHMAKSSNSIFKYQSKINVTGKSGNNPDFQLIRLLYSHFRNGNDKFSINIKIWLKTALNAQISKINWLVLVFSLILSAFKEKFT